MEYSNILISLLSHIYILIPMLSKSVYDCSKEMYPVIACAAHAIWKEAMLLLMYFMLFSIKDKTKSEVFFIAYLHIHAIFLCIFSAHGKN